MLQQKRKEKEQTRIQDQSRYWKLALQCAETIHRHKDQPHISDIISSEYGTFQFRLKSEDLTRYHHPVWDELLQSSTNDNLKNTIIKVYLTCVYRVNQSK
jgi:DNA gyrase inhibitor GyrI